MGELVFTVSSLLDLLTQIEELKDYEISLSDQGSDLMLSIGESTYTIAKSSAEEVSVDEEVVDEVSEICQEGYDSLEEVTLDAVEGGLLKEIAKTLLIGGMVRLTDKLLDKNRK